MKDAKDFISASEINRFCYCPWQWYYERKYGIQKLRRLQRERAEALGLTNDTARESALAKGRAFHQHYLGRYTWRLRLRRLAAVILLAAAIFLLLWARTYYA